MYKSIFLLVFSGCVSLTVQAVELQKSSIPSDEGYQLVWSDEFNVEGPPNPKNWIYEHGFKRNNELQWYQEENAYCRDGNLIIEGRRERIENSNYRPGSKDWRKKRKYANYSSACILSRGKHQWKYGRFQVRAKIDARPGLWPAIWLLGTKRGWPECGEIDVMEYYDDSILANVCWLGENRKPAWDATKRPLQEFGLDWQDDFHVWQLDWDESSLRISVDDKLLNTTLLKDAVNHDRDKTEPFHEPQYILLNLAIGGNRGGNPSSTRFPAQFIVDYVRVFQKMEQETTP